MRVFVLDADLSAERVIARSYSIPVLCAAPAGA